ncbi:hypothetical protein AAFF_G00308030 [Aldrovandia affinis]|uniref:Collagen alpha-6(VI) chain n=1 Tax=Aldrovandia affinis TaxID=143900 RepID=A0AAD7R848_9TELE|nr:hypothetical protein AAFF_G00308030 [Aldrovandia affinis]
MEQLRVAVFIILLVTLCTCQKTDSVGDVLFLVDGSSRLNIGTFLQMKNLIIKITTELDKVFAIGRDVRVGVSQYSGDVKDEVLLSTNVRRDELQSFVKRGLVQKQGQRKMGMALEHVRDVLERSRKLKDPQILVVFSGGKSQDEFSQAAKMIERLQVSIITVGFQDYDAAELNFGKQQFVRRGNPQVFQDILNSIKNELNELNDLASGFTAWEKQPACKKITADILFFVHYSANIGEKNFQRIQHFLYNVFSAFEIGDARVRIGLTKLSGDRTAGFPLNRYSDQAALLQHVQDMQYVRSGGSPSVASASQLLSSGGRGDQFVPQVAVFLTDDGSLRDMRRLASSLQTLGVSVFAVGVGARANGTHLLSTVSYPPREFILTADTFEQLASSLQDEFINRLCFFLFSPKGATSDYILKQGCINTEEVDIYFMIDGSGSITEFSKITEFLSEMVDILKGRQEGMRFGVVQYGSIVVDEILLGQYTATQDLKRAIEGITQLKGGTNTAQGLRHMKRLFEQSSSPNAEKYLIVLTDGASDDEGVAGLAEELRNMPVHMYAIGVGEAKVAELSAIAGSTDRYFHINNFHFLEIIKEALTKEICLPAAVKAAEADMVFLLSSSTNYNQVKEFIVKFLPRFSIGEDGVRVAMIQYNDEVHPTFLFDTYEDESAVLHAIEAMPPIQGPAYTGRALETVPELFKNARKYVDKVVVVVTDEKSKDSVETIAKNVRKSGVSVYSVGGPNADIEEQVYISGSSDKSFRLESDTSDLVKSMTNEIIFSNKACRNIRTVDIVFAVDGSSGMANEFESVKDFMISVVNDANVGKNDTQFAVTVYSNEPKEAFGLTKYQDKASLVQAIAALNLFTDHSFTPATAEAMNFSKTLLSEERGGRRHKNVPQVMIVITARDSDAKNKLNNVANAVRASGIYTIAIGVKPASAGELKIIAGSEDYSFPLNTFEELKKVKNAITTKICQIPYCACMKIDVSFLIDGSESIHDNDFERMKEFVKAVAESLDLCSNNSRVGLAQYSDNYTKYFDMSHFCPREKVNDKMTNIVKLEEGTWIGKALKYSRSFFTSEKQRHGIVSHMIVMTDGKTKREDNPDVGRNAKLLRNIDRVDMIAVAIGDQQSINSINLNQIAGKPSNVFRMEHYEDLAIIQGQIVSHLCGVEQCPDEKPPCRIDIAVGVDVTRVRGASTHVQLGRNILPIVRGISLLQTSSCTSSVLLRFGLHMDPGLALFSSAFQNLTSFESSTYFRNPGVIDQPARLNREYLSSFGEKFQRDSSTQTHKVILIFTDGIDDDKQTLKDVSKQLMETGVDGLITVALQRGPATDGLQSIEFGRGYYYKTQLVIGDKMSEELYTVFDNLAEDKCCHCCKCVGPIGPKGGPAKPGTKGEKGHKAGPGFPGDEGPPGVPGPPGSPGQTGDVGCDGDRGLKGSYGYSGIKGDQGDGAWDGIDGSEGDVGNPGLKGEKGIEGNLGSPGGHGPPAEKGRKGFPGNPGRPGFDSTVPGRKGEDGTMGPEGNPGEDGFGGRNGDPGRDGAGGRRGSPGSQGSSGLSGVNGVKGEAGPSGGQGQSGAKGEDGDPGGSGLKGPLGTQGPGGYGGAKGSHGRSGRKGQSGDLGLKGQTGSPGFRGISGFNGQESHGGKGQKGRRGDPGCHGHWGAPGPKGGEGPPGEVGPKGTHGKPGDGGWKGAKGTPGGPGYDGRKGPKGPPGVWEKTECELIDYIAKNCACKGCRGCPRYPLELVIAVDVSRRVPDAQFNRMSELVSRMVREISVSESTCPSGARVALLSYADGVKRKIRFSDYRTKNKLLELVKERLAKEREVKGEGRNLGEAMMYTARHMFKRARSGKLVKKMAVFLTGGPPTDGDALHSAVVELGAQGIVPVIVTTGQANDCPGRYEIINEYLRPETVINRLNQCFFCFDVCRPDPACQPEVCLRDVQMDVAFLLDSADGMSAAEFETARAVVSGAVDVFSRPCSDGGGAGLALVQTRGLGSQEEGPAIVEFDFARFRADRTAAKQHIVRSLRRPQGSDSSLGLALEYVTENLFLEPRRVRAIVTLLGSGAGQPDHRLMEAAHYARCKGYVLFTLALGRQVNARLVELLSSPPLSSHSRQLGTVSAPDVQYALRFTEFSLATLTKRLGDYRPPQDCGETAHDFSHLRPSYRYAQVWPMSHTQSDVRPLPSGGQVSGLSSSLRFEDLEPSPQDTEQETKHEGHLADEPEREQGPAVHPTSASPPPSAAHCLQSKEYGRACGGLQAIRWFYNRRTRICSIFWYGGCGGNRNRFPTKARCLQLCAPQRSLRPAGWRPVPLPGP